MKSHTNHSKLWIVCLFAFALMGWSTLAAAQTQTTVVFLGDSLTEGYGIEKSQAFPALFDNKAKALGYDLKVVNAGISGSTTASSMSRMKWYLRIKPDIVVLALGANDGLRGLSTEEMKKNLGTTIQMAQDRGIQVLLAGMQMPPNYGIQYTRDFKNAFFELAEQYKVPIIPFLLDGVGGLPEMNLPDGIHPNEEGHKIIAELVAKHLLPLLPKSQS